MTKERLLNPKLIDRIGLINFKYRREIERLRCFTEGMQYGIHKILGHDVLSSSCYYNSRTMSFHVTVMMPTMSYPCRYALEEIINISTHD